MNFTLLHKREIYFQFRHSIGLGWSIRSHVSSVAVVEILSMQSKRASLEVWLL
jgi:hypothetical protein